MSKQDVDTFRTIVLVLGLLIAFTVVIIILSNIIPGKSDNDRALTGENSGTQSGQLASTTGAAPSAGSAIGKTVYQQTCVACHGMGIAGAPKTGDKQAWTASLAKGLPTLYAHAIHGFKSKNGVMPPKGGSSELSDAKVKAAVDYMVGQVDPALLKQGAAATTKSSAPPTAAKGDDDHLALGKKVYGASCFACHGTGAAGAPKAGDKQAWTPRIAKGLPVLYKHAVHGFKGKTGFMPAKGGNAALSDTEVKAAVDYMVSVVK